MANNVATTWRFLRGKGFTPAQAAGVIGVMQGESGRSLSTVAQNPSSGAYGIAQWLGGRKSNLFSHGNPKSLNTQLNYLWSELQGPERAALHRIKNAHSIDEAVNAWLYAFERPGPNEANLGVRTANARRTFNALHGVRGGAIPSGGGGGGGNRTIPGRPGSTRTESTTTVIPGVDNRLARASLIQSFLDDHSSIDPLDFAVQARQLQDVAPSSTTETRTFRTPGTPGRSVRVPGHGRISPQGAGSSFAKSHSPLLELIHKTNSGPGYAVKNGKVVSGPQVFGGVWDGHADHVHVAAGPKTVVELGKLAQRLGLHVGENPHFGGVNPVHVRGSYHYRGEAIDVSGDPGKMNHFAAEVKRLYGLR